MIIVLTIKEVKQVLKLLEENSGPAKQIGENQYIANKDAHDLKMIRRKLKDQLEDTLECSGWKDPDEGSLPSSGHLLIERDDYTMTSGNMADDYYFAPDNAPSGVDYLIPVSEILRWKYYPEEGED